MRRPAKKRAAKRSRAFKTNRPEQPQTERNPYESNDKNSYYRKCKEGRITFIENQAIYDVVYRYLGTSQFYMTKIAFLAQDKEYILCKPKTLADVIRENENFDSQQHRHVYEWFKFQHDNPIPIKEKNSKGIMVLKIDVSLLEALCRGLMYKFLQPCLSKNTTPKQLLSLVSIASNCPLKMFDIFWPSILNEKLKQLKCLHKDEFDQILESSNKRNFRQHINSICVFDKTPIEVEGRLSYLCMDWSLKQPPNCCWYPCQSFLTITNKKLMEFLSVNFATLGPTYMLQPTTKIEARFQDEAISSMQWADKGEKLAIGTNKGTLIVYGRTRRFGSSTELDLYVHSSQQVQRPTNADDSDERKQKNYISSLTWINKNCFCFLINKRYMAKCTILKSNEHYPIEQLDLSFFTPVALSKAPTKDYVAVYGKYGHVVVINTLPNLTLTHRYATHNCMRINDCRFNKTGTIMASAGCDNSLRMYSLDKSRNEVEQSILSFRGNVTCLDWASAQSGTQAWPHSYNILAAGSADGYMRVWLVIDNYDIKYELIWSRSITEECVHKIEFAHHPPILATAQGSIGKSFVSIWDFSKKTLLYECKSWWSSISQMLWNGEISSKLLVVFENDDSPPDKSTKVINTGLLIINLRPAKSSALGQCLVDEEENKFGWFHLCA